ncbi:MAG: hypothetical protein UX80_C0002G0063 [Candidatus Amesbacteria bacterium GW2011_GWA2_47_11b]|uniref:Uncharacterized protein n=2 Tax=Candidatus Amesiibacteriota TaxID=1752730 RepID=A0A0G1SLP0_9BACT|nr:MAG: hypothetical protein UT95_C0003G0039 [Candidatus Curtissbacteria bacterium GW2011_GWB1_40_28]KKU29426.1 MAG: hypothetical protein UX42_C0001G0178 [Microgenomates group bacterium GW2011_GWC1_46_20]KKU58528.1 MAG: hypothetical protein UX80_C0002G0063 [Candidatus Amesbacteria bacterium GW2011_GWA2_47_11b]KKU70367.1 MAG: hypothetical protein UX92_C0001G0035 [Candidatus Amesbacteria bacterium GW2011_GWA1_47_20]HCH59306.1 hypothetical protein [Candidatus Zambryskibacteria bacterium]
MRRFINQALQTSTFRQSVVTVFSTFATAGLGAVFYLFLARLVGAHEYGLFSVVISFLTIVATIADLGMNQGLIRFVAENSQSNQYQPYAKIALLSKLLISSIILVGFVFLAQPITGYLLHQQEVYPLLPLAGLGAVFILLFSFSTSVLQGLQKFVLWGGLQVAANFFRLVLFGTLFLILKINAYWGLILFGSAPFLGFVVSWFWLPLSIFQSKFTPRQFCNFWNFNKWTAAFVTTSVLASRLDILLSARFLSLSETGVYSLATTMVAFLPQLSGAIGAVTAPKFASFSDSSHSQKYLAKAALFSFGTSLAVALAMIPAALVVVWFIGRDFSASFTPFLILLASLAIFTSLNPVRDSIMYFYKRPQFFFWANLAQAAIIVAVGLLLIPRFGVVGTALAVLISHIFFAVASFMEYENCRAHHS